MHIMKIGIMFCSSKWRWKIINCEYESQTFYCALNPKHSLTYGKKNFFMENPIQKCVCFWMELSIINTPIVVSAITWPIVTSNISNFGFPFMFKHNMGTLSLKMKVIIPPNDGRRRVAGSGCAVDFFRFDQQLLNRSLKNQFFSIFGIFDHVWSIRQWSKNQFF